MAGAALRPRGCAAATGTAASADTARHQPLLDPSEGEPEGPGPSRPQAAEADKLPLWWLFFLPMYWFPQSMAWVAVGETVILLTLPLHPY